MPAAIRLTLQIRNDRSIACHITDQGGGKMPEGTGLDTGPPGHLTGDELRHYIESHNENSYVLIDVRQPSEYQAAHIPGATFMPLLEFESKLFELPPDRDLIFYCRTGGRSVAAALLAQEAEVTTGRIYNLLGGITQWSGRTIEDFPRVQVFDSAGDFTELLRTAMDLEKGAWRFYQAIVDRSASAPYLPAFEQLSRAETAHARAIYQIWAPRVADAQPFETLYALLKGDILEGGETLEDMLQRLDTLEGGTCMSLIEISMQIEYAAFDLYRVMADRSEDPDSRSAFLSIAEAEKGHMRLLTRAIELCSG
jgi:rhodanese-related sulfurtransferase/rubrerythrin